MLDVCVPDSRRRSVFGSCRLLRSASERWGQYLAGSSPEGVCTRLAKQRPAERASESVRAENRNHITYPAAFFPCNVPQDISSPPALIPSKLSPLPDVGRSQKKPQNPIKTKLMHLALRSCLF